MIHATIPTPDSFPFKYAFFFLFILPAKDHASVFGLLDCYYDYVR